MASLLWHEIRSRWGAILGWGIGLAFHFKAVYYPGHRRLDRRLRPHHGGDRLSMCVK